MFLQPHARRAQQSRQKCANNPSPSQLLTAQEMADAAPFYFVLCAFVEQLKQARLAAGLTLADVSEKTGMAIEYLSRLENGTQTNSTWKTLGTYAAAVGREPSLTAETPV